VATSTTDTVQFADLVRRSRRIAVLTGAGISTPSGIPDFRSPGGLHSDERNANVFDIASFRRDPHFFYDFARRFYPLLAAAKPNAVHEALAKWERAGKDVRIATQNIDDLHQRAGSTRVYPVHGTLATSTCLACGRGIETMSLEADVLGGDVPRCECGGVFKPDITFFGELLPERTWEGAMESMAGAELVLVLGTSLVVYPAAALPDCRPAGVPLVIVNRDPTSLDREADLVVRGDLGVIMSRVSQTV
jgi:NAD-dependent deacetylase